MLEQDTAKKYSEFKVKELGIKLARLGRIVEHLEIPVLIVLEGWESSGRGEIIYNIVRELNPKFYDVKVFEPLSEKEKAYPEMTPYWNAIPEKSHIRLFDRSYYYELFNHKEASAAYDLLKQGIENYEKALYDDYTVVVKFFVNVTEKTQRENMEALIDDGYEQVYVEKLDREQNKHYEAYAKRFEHGLEATNYSFAPWHILDGADVKEASKEALGILIDQLQIGIERMLRRREGGMRLVRHYQGDRHPLAELDLTKTLSEDDYDAQLKDLQKDAADLQLKLFMAKVPTVLVFEGVDAAGKDGSIERLIKRMDPRMVKVHAISAPSAEENRYHYLWRFYKRLPEDGKMSVFSRSWYGRVMVERVEGFAEKNEWERAYKELPQFEKELYDHGALVLKYFVMIDKDTQLTRFEDREDDPDKQYKITEEDWRNRNKWDDYIEAMDEMLERTHRDYAPWILVEGNDKNYARIKVLKTFIQQAKAHLKAREGKDK
ncbi:hypothetical protein O6R05_06150 [Peptoniphilus equinus]|uniref:Polyphosphate kinase-2-related domain-containing protein n=1 Tax=Peptoniphilus equinus TaxID=3016343 RepID=A0ABY7QTA6_9FIRM|nr:hypothetical protein [Peptoniphilus equinus]WBW49576.1 hypothetical protein O6R05_06150 [Peptoniphilus equinus]